MFGDDDDDDDESQFEIGMFENGHWVWDDFEESLDFVGHNVSHSFENTKRNFTKPPVESIVFKNELELIQQLTFKKKYMRKIADGETEIITLQDIVDIVLYTAPKMIVCPLIIHMLHSSTGERFLRALIVYTQYFIQVSYIMKHRAAESTLKIRTPESDKIENTLRDDLSELRAIVAHEYNYMNMEIRKANKQRQTRSLLVDSRLTETFLRLAAQIVWIALSRPRFEVINVEINRIFRTSEYNIALKHVDAGVIRNMSQQEKNVLLEENRKENYLGACYCKEKDAKHKYVRISPATCSLLSFSKDYRTTGIGSMGIKKNKSSIRAEYLEKLICAQEDVLIEENINIGILGQPKSQYDLLFVEIKIPKERQRISFHASGLKIAKSSFSSKKSMGQSSLFRNVHRLEIPPACNAKHIPLEFHQLPTKYEQRKPNFEQKRKWLARFMKQSSQKKSYSLNTLNSSGVLASTLFN